MSSKQRTQPPAYRVRLGRRIAELRRQRGLSQGDLAEALGTATESISRIERAAAVPSLGLLARIASVLGVEVEDVFSTKAPTTRRRPDPSAAKLVALVKSKPPALRRKLLRLVRQILSLSK
ncbi:MAG: helix-turn-helix transcriptional regulator [Deltaproteobacteria bacterium]|nr:helix-turn-helix transcriptional regulator [Deltaproteobacteria bacterium]